MNCIGATLTVVSYAAVVWTHHTTPFISRLRESALRDETKKRLRKRLLLLLLLQQRENQNYSSTVSYLKNIIPVILLRKANWNSVLPPIDPNQRYIWWSMYLWRYIDQEKKIIIKRGLLDWLLLIWTLPSVCEIRDKMQVVLQGINTQLDQSKVA